MAGALKSLRSTVRWSLDEREEIAVRAGEHPAAAKPIMPFGLPNRKSGDGCARTGTGDNTSRRKRQGDGRAKWRIKATSL